MVKQYTRAKNNMRKLIEKHAVVLGMKGMPRASNCQHSNLSRSFGHEAVWALGDGNT